MTKKCPFCAEDIQQDAVVCKHCGRNLPGGSIPKRGKAVAQPSTAGYGLLALGFLVLVATAAALVLGSTAGGWLLLAAFVFLWIGIARTIPGGSVTKWGGGFLGAALVVVLVGMFLPFGRRGGSAQSQGRAVMPQLLGQAAPVVTKAEFDRIREGMTYQEVASIISAPGELQSSGDLAGIKTVMYSWMNANGSNMNAMFQNNKLIQKAQFGLP